MRNFTFQALPYIVRTCVFTVPNRVVVAGRVYPAYFSMVPHLPSLPPPHPHSFDWQFIPRYWRPPIMNSRSSHCRLLLILLITPGKIPIASSPPMLGRHALDFGVLCKVLTTTLSWSRELSWILDGPTRVYLMISLVSYSF